MNEDWKGRRKTEVRRQLNLSLVSYRLSLNAMLGPCCQCVCVMGVWNGRRDLLFCSNYPGHEGELTHVSGTRHRRGLPEVLPEMGEDGGRGDPERRRTLHQCRARQGGDGRRGRFRVAQPAQVARQWGTRGVCSRHHRRQDDSHAPAHHEPTGRATSSITRTATSTTTVAATSASARRARTVGTAGSPAGHRGSKGCPGRAPAASGR